MSDMDKDEGRQQASGRGTPPGELDSYGVWVKSSPAAMADEKSVADMPSDAEQVAQPQTGDIEEGTMEESKLPPDMKDIDLSQLESDDAVANEMEAAQDFMLVSSGDDVPEEETKSDVLHIQDDTDSEIAAPSASKQEGDRAVDEGAKDATEQAASDALGAADRDSKGDIIEDIAQMDASGQDAAASIPDGEVSLDDFMGGGDGDISLDDFMGEGFSAAEEKKEETPDEPPLEMDLNFDAEPLETIETDDIGVEIEDISGDSGEEEPEVEEETPEGSAEDGVGGVNLDDFADVGSMFATDDSGAPKVSAPAAETEEVDLSDFGIDADAEETAVTSNVAENKGKLAVVDYDLTVSMDDDVAAAPVVSEVPQGKGEVQDETKIESSAAFKEASDAIKQIASSLTSLQDEINSIKREMADIKEHGIKTSPAPQERDAAVSSAEDNGPFEVSAPVQEGTPEGIAEGAAAEGLVDEDIEAEETAPSATENEAAEESASKDGAFEEPPVAPEPPAAAIEDLPSMEELPQMSEEGFTADETQQETQGEETQAEAPQEETQAEAPQEEEPQVQGLQEEPQVLPDMPEMPLPEAASGVVSSGGGFFSDDDGDDSIALSGDELSNMMSNAVIEEAPAVAPETAGGAPEGTAVETPDGTAGVAPTDATEAGQEENAVTPVQEVESEEAVQGSAEETPAAEATGEGALEELPAEMAEMSFGDNADESEEGSVPEQVSEEETFEPPIATGEVLPGETTETAEEVAVTPDEDVIPVVEMPASSSGGFFSDDGGDDSIALSGDELSNMMSNAVIEEAPSETSETENEKMPVEESAEEVAAEGEVAEEPRIIEDTSSAAAQEAPTEEAEAGAGAMEATPESEEEVSPSADDMFEEPVFEESKVALAEDAIGDEDDVTLSGDELSNVMNNAIIEEEPASSEIDTAALDDFSADFAQESTSSPDSETEGTEALPDEISLPVGDDFEEPKVGFIAEPDEPLDEMPQDDGGDAAVPTDETGENTSGEETGGVEDTHEEAATGTETTGDTENVAVPSVDEVETAGEGAIEAPEMGDVESAPETQNAGEVDSVQAEMSEAQLEEGIAEESSEAGEAQGGETADAIPPAEAEEAIAQDEERNEGGVVENVAVPVAEMPIEEPASLESASSEVSREDTAETTEDVVWITSVNDIAGDVEEPVAETTAGETATEEAPMEETPVGETPADKMPAGETPVAGEDAERGVQEGEAETAATEGVAEGSVGESPTEAPALDETESELSEDDIEYLNSDKPLEGRPPLEEGDSDLGDVQESMLEEAQMKAESPATVAEAEATVGATETEATAVPKEADAGAVASEPIQGGESKSVSSLPSDLQGEVKAVLMYMDELLENLPEDKIAEFARSEQFVTYKKLFDELGLS